MTEWAIRQTSNRTSPPVAMLYFHPWEFDTLQEPLPLGRCSQFRTYIGIGRTRNRLSALFGKYSFARAIDVAERLDRTQLTTMNLAASCPDVNFF